MSLYNLDTEQPAVITSTEVILALNPKKPGLAFVLSLLFPGLGHFYCGKLKSAAWIALCFAVLASVVIFVSPSASPMLWGLCLRAAIVFYAFAFLDAYFTAREINAGIAEQIVGNNPRIAAMLNLLTAGFGYFYLGERGKGLAWFLVSRVLMAAGAAKVGALGVFVEFACGVVAVDAYRIAKQQIRESISPEQEQLFRNQRCLTPFVPGVFGLILLLNYALVLTVGFSMPHYKSLNRTRQTTTADSSGGTHFENRSYGVSLDFPPGWELQPDRPDMLIRASYPELACQFSMNLHAQLPIKTREGFAREMESIWAKNPSYKWLSEGPIRIGEKEAYGINFQMTYNRVPVLQRTIFLQHHLTLYAVNEATSLATGPECTAMMDEIVRSTKLNF